MTAEPILRNLIASSSKSLAKKLIKQNIPASIANAMSGHAVRDSGITQTHVIPVDCFPFEYILGQTGIPLHRIITIQGTTASAKSSMFWFMARAFLSCGGLVIYFDLENKHEPRTAQAYIGNPIAYRNRVYVYPSTVVECFSVQLQSVLSALRNDKAMKGRPILIGIDTLGSALGAKHISDMKQGKADPGFSTAKATYIQQMALQQAISLFLPELPLTIVGLQQERNLLESQERKATGGSFSGYAKSVALRMEKYAYWKYRDERLPLIRVSQEKQSNNTQRDISLVVPCDVTANGLPFRSYSFQWQYSMLQLLADLSDKAASCLEGIFKVEKDQLTFSVKKAGRSGTDSEWLEKYKCTKASHKEAGPALLADVALRDLLRERVNLNAEPVFATPYRVPLSLSGGLWLGPEEDDEWASRSEDDILQIHRSALVKMAAEDDAERKAAAAKSLEDDESEDDVQEVSLAGESD